MLIQMKRILSVLLLLLIGSQAADNVVNTAFVQQANQGRVAPLAATDNGDGTWTLKVSTISGASNSTTAATFTQGVKAVVSAGTPLVLTGSAATLVDSVEIHARKNTTTANTGAIYIGFSASAGSNYRVLLPGESMSITAPMGKKIDLHLIFVDAATTADAVAWTALN